MHRYSININKQRRSNSFCTYILRISFLKNVNLIENIGVHAINSNW